VKVLVTGGSGFIGNHVVNKLLAHGVEVRILDMLAPLETRDHVEFTKGSILNIDDVRTSLSRIDAVIHLAAVADVKDVYNEPHYSEEINVRGTANVLEAMRQVGKKRLVFGSTTWVYSDVAETDVDETTPLMPPSHLYTASKIAGEHYCRSYSQLYGMEPTILRFGIPYGPGARPGAVIPIFVDKAIKGDPLTLQGDGLQFRKFIYVEDLAEGIVAGLKPVAINQTYNLDGTRKVSIREIAETVQKILGDVTIEYVEARPGDFVGKDASSEKALSELGWQASTPFEDGVRRYIEWFQAQTKERAESQARVDPALL
jgi:UDP-glucose 4-epimerase